MSIGIIADEIAMVEPFHLACMEEILELSVDVILGERLVAVRGEEALGCRKIVPLPSLSMLPPSRTNPVWFSKAASKAPW